jgi:carboxypeptidase D
LICISGGPGCSSLEGFLQENGQFVWGWGQWNGLPNPYSWVNLTNVIWVEYPVGTGFSTGKVTATSEEEISQDFLGFFKNFQDTFGISDYKIYITGESYAGRYVPYTGAAMVDANDTKYFDVSGILMYDPCVGQCGYIEQTVAAYPYVEKNYEFFKFNDTYMASLKKAHTDCGYEEYIKTYLTYPPPGLQPALPSTTYQYNTTSKSCDIWNNVINGALQNNPCFNVYEISDTCPILFDPLSFPTILAYNYAEFDGPFFNRSAVKKALHVPESVSWAECASEPVFVKGNDYSADPIQHVLPKLIEKTGRVLIGGGDYDFEILNQGTLLAIQNMTWNGYQGFQSEPTSDIVIELPDLLWGPTFIANGLAGYDGPGQGTMGVSHFERGLMWAQTFQSGHM